MNDIVDIFEDESEYLPSTNDFITSLLNHREHKKGIIETLKVKLDEIQDLKDVLVYFESPEKRIFGFRQVGDIFDFETAMKKLDADCWNKLIRESRLFDIFPHSKRKKWDDDIHELRVPEFTESTVRDTYAGLMAERWGFLSDMVSDLFTNLSGEHVTNSPEGFNKRMIYNYAIESRWRNDIHFRYDRISVLHDLRTCLFKINGYKGDLEYSSTNRLCRYLTDNIPAGEWFTADAGLFRIRWYYKGTVHIEINPQFAWKLNKILNMKYPNVIPSKFRKKPVRTVKDFEMIDNPVPYNIIEVLEQLSFNAKPPESFAVRLSVVSNKKHDSFLLDRVDEVLSYIGGSREESVNKNFVGWVFDYPPEKIIEKVIHTGRLPDRKTYQYYPTPRKIAEYACDVCDVQATDEVLEPSAGIGSLIEPLSETGCAITCVELSDIFCEALRKKSHVRNVYQADFLKWADIEVRKDKRYDKVVMNPPFSDGRVVAHIQKALSLLKSSGRLVAILPSSYKDKADLFSEAGRNRVSFGKTFRNLFDETGIEVVVMIVDKG